MILPFPPRRSQLSIFWLALNAQAALTAGAVAAAFDVADEVWVALGASALAFCLTGLMWRDGIMLVYRLWNKVGTTVARVGRWWVLAVTYFVVLFAARSRAGGLELSASSESMWKRYGLDAAGATALCTRQDGGWLRRLVQAAGPAQHRWWLGLMPFLLVLSCFPDEGGDQEPPANVYTLF